MREGIGRYRAWVFRGCRGERQEAHLAPKQEDPARARETASDRSKAGDIGNRHLGGSGSEPARLEPIQPSPGPDCPTQRCRAYGSPAGSPHHIGAPLRRLTAALMHRCTLTTPLHRTVTPRCRRDDTTTGAREIRHADRALLLHWHRDRGAPASPCPRARPEPATSPRTTNHTPHHALRTMCHVPCAMCHAPRNAHAISCRWRPSSTDPVIVEIFLNSRCDTSATAHQ